MAFTEFCCRSGGSNLNAGTRDGSSTEPGTTADFTYTSGNWVASTGVFTVASGDPASDGVAVGDFASVYADGSTETGFVGRITARDATTITVSLTAKAGTAPTDGTGTRTLKVGGAWQGPNGASWFPLTLTNLYLAVNASSNPPRINLKNDQTYSVTVNCAFGQNYLEFGGYGASYGDAGRATIDSGSNAIDVLTLTSGASYNKLFNLTGISTYTASGVNRFIIIGGNLSMAYNCVASGFRWEGFSGGGQFIECEAYGCAGGQPRGAFYLNVDSNVIRCTSHDNSSHGFEITGQATISNCIADTNSGDGIKINSVSGVSIISCDCYNNGSDGIELSGGVLLHPISIQSSNLIKNGGYGIRGTSAGRRGLLFNCGFGSGTQANVSGSTVNIDQLGGLGNINYAADITPWVDPANGDFSINLAAAQGAGRGSFTQTASGYGGTAGYPDIGAAQSLAAGGGVRQVNIRGGADQ